MREDVWSHYGTWWAVVLWILMYGAFLLFVPFYRKADRKPAGVFLAFVVAFALEMFGAPLSLYFVMWAFGRELPEGILWGHTLVDRIGNAGTWICVVTTLAGGALVVSGWSRIHARYWGRKEGEGRLVEGGPYRWIRHPQYAGFLLMSLGVLFEWATIPLVLLWPVLLLTYLRLARREEAEMEARFGLEWTRYAARTGRFLPRLGGGRARSAGLGAALALAALLAFAPAGASAEGLTWSSYAEAGLGLSLSGGKARPLVALDSGLTLGGIELGTYLAILPLEFGNPDLVEAAAVHYGGTIGAVFGGGSLRPFGRLGVGGVVRDRADAEGGFDGVGAAKSLSISFVAGVELPLGGRWSLRPWAAWRLSPGAEDYEGLSLGGPDLGLAFRATWETTLR